MAGSQPTTFYIGHQDNDRRLCVSEELLAHAIDCGYDMIVSPITNADFQARVLLLLQGHRQSLHEASNDAAFTADINHAVAPAPSISSLTPSDTSLTPGQSISQIILHTSPWIDLSSPDPLIADISRQVLNLEIAYASFCGASNVMVHGPRGLRTDGLGQFARAIQEGLSLGSYVNLHLICPMVEDSKSEAEIDDDNLSIFASAKRDPSSARPVQARRNDFDSWEAWNSIRSLCRYHARLSVALEVPRQLPTARIQSRWYSEPLRILVFPGSTFHTNVRGNSVFSKGHQELLVKYMRLRHCPWILVRDIGPLPPDLDPPTETDSVWNETDFPSLADSSVAIDTTLAGASTQGGQLGPTTHLDYLRYLQRRQPARDAVESFSAGYQDYLQSPLQPLTDNLESMTYEVFEKDPIKYDWYERAIGRALYDWKQCGKPASGPDGKVIVAVVGAGRGPLVTRAIEASAASGVAIDIWALEKNPNAMVLLHQHNKTTWQNRVNLVQDDMRSWRGPVYYNSTSSTPSPAAGRPANSESTTEANMKTTTIDILVSELLGSFADNELSPECIDGVQHLLNPSHGMSIPTSYSAHLTPIAAPKLHADIVGRAATADPDAAQIPYVVMFQAVDYLSTERSNDRDEHGTTKTSTIPIIEEAWTFSHPLPLHHLRPATNGHNKRFARLEFPCSDRGTCHGIAGYFETILYSAETSRESHPKVITKVELSTNPLTMEQKSKDMISWFPIFFPLKTPLYFPDQSVLVISVWRQTDGRRVWYEWLVESFMDLGAERGRIRLGGSDLHSSIGSACLM